MAPKESAKPNTPINKNTKRTRPQKVAASVNTNKQLFTVTCLLCHKAFASESKFLRYCKSCRPSVNNLSRYSQPHKSHSDDSHPEDSFFGD